MSEPLQWVLRALEDGPTRLDDAGRSGDARRSDDAEQTDDVGGRMMQAVR